MTQYCIEGFEEIFDKVIRGEELTWEEVRDIYWEYPTMEEVIGEHTRWHYYIDKIFQVYDKYYRITIMCGATECQDNEYEPQVAIEVEPREKVVTEWVAVNEYL